MYKQFVQDHAQDLADKCAAAWAAQDPAAAVLVDDVWRRIDERLLLPPTERNGGGDESPDRKSWAERGRRRTWATVRLYVSSTVEDFFAERECLARRVFPALRDWCEARRIALHDCDLRLGAEADAVETACACLELVDRCRSEADVHGAFFLGLVGDRFGWTPAGAELTPDLAERLDGWVPGGSLTQMELLRGALVGGASRNALFMLRDPACYADLAPSGLLSDFAEPAGSLPAAHAARHRLEIVRRFPADQLSAYSPRYRHRETAEGLDAFEECVLAFIKRAIAEQFPEREDGKAALTDAETGGDSNEAHVDHMQSLAEAGATSGQERCLGLLTNFVETGELSMADFKLFGDSADHIAFGLPGVKSVVIAGDAGIGKSTVLARLGTRFLDRKGFEVLAHFAQFSPASNDRRTLQRKMKAFLKGLLPEAEAAKIGDDASVSELFNPVMQVRRTMLIIIDAFECFYEVSHVGELLPVAWPQNVRCVVSCRRRDLDRCFSERSVCMYELEGLDAEAQAAVCRRYHVSDGQTSGLLGRPAAAVNPLWLSQACAELRRSCRSGGRDVDPSELPGDARALLKSVAARLIAEDRDQDGSAAALLALVCVARVGLWERHARRMVRFAVERRRRDGVEAATAEAELPLRDYLRLLRDTEPFLRTIARESTALAFRHELARLAVRDLLLDSPELAKRWHSLAADFILLATPADPCQSRDLPYHLYWSDRRCELHAILQGASVTRRLFGQRISHLTASGVYGSWRCRVPKVADKSPGACLVACGTCAREPSRVGQQERARCCIYCGQALSPSGRPGTAVPATACRQHLAPSPDLQRCWFCAKVCGVDGATPLQVCNFCNSAASSYLCYQPVLETDEQFAQVVRNQTKKFGLQW